MGTSARRIRSAKSTVQPQDPVELRSEIGALRKVIVHAPGPEWDLVPCIPGALASYLIEDIFVLSKAREEHECFTRILGSFIGPENVLEFEDVLTEVCQHDTSRREIVAGVSACHSLGSAVSRSLEELSPADLCRALIHGAIVKSDDKNSYTNLFPPIPNLLFTRDLGAAIPGGFIICHAAKEARRRETLLMRYLLRNNMFKGATIVDVRDFANEVFWNDLRAGQTVSIEGGDIVVLDDHTVMIGTGERTTSAAVYLLLKKLRDVGSPIRMVIRAVIPAERASMHLDTIFTVISKEEFMVYSPVIEEEASFVVYRAPFTRQRESEDRPMTFAEAMREARLEHVDLVKCGHENELFQSREQWTDGANFLAVAPGILLGYDRNIETVNALRARKSGYRYLQATRDMAEIERAAQRFREGDAGQRIVIGLPGSELSRARGGPRCMSMPLKRDQL